MKSLLWLAIAFALGQGGETQVKPVAGPVMLDSQPNLLESVEAMPVMADGGGIQPAVTGKVNAALRRLDAKVKAAAEACDDKWTRKIVITMRGPRYFSLFAADAFSCQAELRKGDILPLVYDLETGGTVNWLKLLPPGVSSGVDNAADGNKIGAVIWPVLTDLARSDAEKHRKNCVDFFSPDSQVPFVLGLSAASGAVVAWPVGLPDHEGDCSIYPVHIDVEQARKIGGFDAGLLDALTAAQKLQH